MANRTTIKAPVNVSFPVGQDTLNASFLTPCINFNGLIILSFYFGRSGGTRTHNLRFWRPALYQLSYTPSSLLNNFGYHSSSNCFTTFSNSKIKFFTHSYWGNKFNGKFCIITWHNHFGSRW